VGARSTANPIAAVLFVLFVLMARVFRKAFVRRPDRRC
jgi:hypothetical protein